LARQLHDHRADASRRSYHQQGAGAVAVEPELVEQGLPHGDGGERQRCRLGEVEAGGLLAGAITNTMAEITVSDLQRRVPAPTTRDEIGQLAGTVNDTLGRLETAVDRQRRFVADASHELRGPLTALRSDLEISITHPEKSPWNDVARDTLGDVERLQQLSDDLLLLARIDAEGECPRRPVDLAALTQEAAHAVRRPDIDVGTSGLDDSAMIVGDEQQLRRMARNLIHNAERMHRADSTSRSGHSAMSCG